MPFINPYLDFLRDLKDPSMDDSLEIIFISSITLYGRLYEPSPSMGCFSDFSL